MTVLVTGGAGYIGSHVARLLRARGDDVVVLDDLSGGIVARVGSTPVVVVDMVGADAVERLHDVMASSQVDAVIHFAAKKQVAESVEKPAWYVRQNVGALANLLEAMEAGGVDRLVYSSSAAVYGATEGDAISEGSPTLPVNPYGRTKLIGEQLVTDAVGPMALRAVSLRYFNVAGAGWDELGDTAVLNLVPMVLEKIDAGARPLIFGDDYTTPDGTCVRDYVHVMDLAEAHLAVLDATSERVPGNSIYNVGTGVGTSVRDMVDRIRALANFGEPAEIRPRRAGDPAYVVADPSLIRDEIGWVAQRGIDEILASAWSSHEYFRTSSAGA
jgi:UDP-glucose 4-epimerase